MYGKSDEQGSSPVDDPVHPTDLVATIYYALGIDPNTMCSTISSSPANSSRASR